MRLRRAGALASAGRSLAPSAHVPSTGGPEHPQVRSEPSDVEKQGSPFQNWSVP